MRPPVRLDLGDDEIAGAVLELQRAAYAVEAALIGSDGIPALGETLDELRNADEEWLGAFDEDGLAGAVSWRLLDDGTVDIHRLVVAPRAFRRGVASALLDGLDAALPDRSTVVSTGSANEPALTLYRRRGFVAVRDREVIPGLWISELERRWAADGQAEGRRPAGTGGVPSRRRREPGRRPITRGIERMAERTNEEVIRAYLRAIVDNDAAAFASLRDPDWTTDYPQSGERIRGHANDRAIADNYPGGLPEVDPGRIAGSEDRWVVTPSFTYQRVAGSGDTWWGEGKARYPDGSTWHVVTMYRLRGGRVLREITYWALPFEPPAWRAAWVEPITPD